MFKHSNLGYFNKGIIFKCLAMLKKTRKLENYSGNPSSFPGLLEKVRTNRDGSHITTGRSHLARAAA